MARRIFCKFCLRLYLSYRLKFCVKDLRHLGANGDADFGNVRVKTLINKIFISPIINASRGQSGNRAHLAGSNERLNPKTSEILTDAVVKLFLLWRKRKLTSNGDRFTAQWLTYTITITKHLCVEEKTLSKLAIYFKNLNLSVPTPPNCTKGHRGVF